MSSAAYLEWDPEEGVHADDWRDFCDRHGIEWSPRTVGRNVFYAGSVEVSFGKAVYDDPPLVPPDYAERITFSTFHGGEAMPEVARLAFACWFRFGGKLAADLEIRRLIYE